MEEVVKALLATNQELTKRIIESNKTLAAVAMALAKARDLPEETPEQEVEWASYPLHVPEGEEDAKHLLRTGQINKAEYENMLEGIGLEPVIEFQ